MKNKNVKYLED